MGPKADSEGLPQDRVLRLGTKVASLCLVLMLGPRDGSQCWETMLRVESQDGSQGWFRLLVSKVGSNVWVRRAEL